MRLAAMAAFALFLAAVPGVTYAAWPADPFVNVPLCTAAKSQLYPTIVSDGVGGAIVAWIDDRLGDNASDIYAQHVLASGLVDPAWPKDGTTLCTAATRQDLGGIVADGTGGAIVVWADERNDNGSYTNYDVYAQHVLASGAEEKVCDS